MLSDDTRAMHVTAAIGFVAIAWIAAYVAFNGPVRALLGGAAHGVTFLALFAAVCAAIVVFMLRHLERLRADLGAGAGFARWQIERPDWEAFAGPEAMRMEEDNRAGLKLLLGFAVVVPILLALFGVEPVVLVIVAAVIAALGLFGFWLSNRIVRAHRRYRDGVVAIGDGGMMVNGAVHSWSLPHSGLVDARLDEDERPACLTILYSHRRRSRGLPVTVRVPVPESGLETARSAVARLKALAGGGAWKGAAAGHAAPLVIGLAAAGLVLGLALPAETAETAPFVLAQKGGRPDLPPPGRILHYDFGNTAAVQSGPRKDTVIELMQPVFVHRLTTYHWNDGRGRKPGSIALLDEQGTLIGRWRARGAPGQGGVRNAYWAAEVGIRLDPGLYILTTSSNESWSTNRGVDWRGFYSMDFELLPDRVTPPTPPRQSPQPKQSPPPSPPPPPFAAEEQQQGEEMPELASETETVAPDAGDPERPLRPGERQEAVLFDGQGGLVAPWVGFSGQGGSYENHVRYEGGALVAEVPAGSGGGLAGIFSERAIVWLDALSNGGETALTFTFDPAGTTGFMIGLSTCYNLNGNEVSTPRVLLHWRQTADGAMATLLRDETVAVELAVPAAAPEQVRVVLTVGGVRFEGKGLPGDLLPWPDLVEAQGLRVYATTRPAAHDAAVSMALRRIELSRTGGGEPPAAELPADGVAPLPLQALFEGEPGGLWQPASTYEGQMTKFLSFGPDGMLAEVPESQAEWAQTGLLSTAPVLRFDERIGKTPYRLRFAVDPGATTGLVVLFNPYPVQSMANQDMTCAFSLIRFTEGPNAGRYQMALRVNQAPYSAWDRSVSTAVLDGAWDGRIDLVFGGGWVRAEIPGILTLRGSGFYYRPGTAQHMTIYSQPEKPYGPSRLLLKKIEGGWLTPSGMTGADRWTLVDDDAFDTDGFLDSLATELEVDGTRPEEK